MLTGSMGGAWPSAYNGRPSSESISACGCVAAGTIGSGGTRSGRRQPAPGMTRNNSAASPAAALNPQRARRVQERRDRVASASGWHGRVTSTPSRRCRVASASGRHGRVASAWRWYGRVAAALSRGGRVASALGRRGRLASASDRRSGAGIVLINALLQCRTCRQRPASSLTASDGCEWSRQCPRRWPPSRWPGRPRRSVRRRAGR